MREVAPIAAFLTPPAILAIAFGVYESQKRAVGNQHPACAEGGHLALMVAVLIVPAVVRIACPVLAYFDMPRGHCDEFILRRLAGIRARCPRRVLAHMLQRVLSDQRRRRFEVYALVLNAHQDRPPGAVPTDR